MQQSLGYVCAMTAWAVLTQVAMVPLQAEPPPDSGDKEKASGYMAMPRCAQPLATEMAKNSIQIFADDAFQGDQLTSADVTTSHKAGALNAYPDTLDDDIASVRWNLEPGVLVIMFEGADGTGDQCALWGKGQITDLSKCGFDDEASRWSWYDISASPSSDTSVGTPHASQPLSGPVSDDSVELFDDQSFKEDRQIIAHVTQQPAGAVHKLPGVTTIRDEKENAASSLRWKLPEGAIVVLSAKDDGTDNRVLFGEGEYMDLTKIGFNNSASRWSWAYITSRH